jgi:hypothetical protein
MNSTLTRIVGMADNLIRHLRRALVRLALITLTVAAVLAMGSALALDTTSVQAATAAPVPAPVGDGWEDHDLFNPEATLSTATIDDLRHGAAAAEGQCLADEDFRVMTPEGECVDAAALWADEVDTATWNALLDAGYTWDIDLSLYEEVDVIRLPADMLILGGPDGEHVLAVHFAPAVSPDGFARSVRYEDGSASYTGSAFLFDGDTASFRLRTTTGQRPV